MGGARRLGTSFNPYTPFTLRSGRELVPLQVVGAVRSMLLCDQGAGGTEGGQGSTPGNVSQQRYTASFPDMVRAPFVLCAGQYVVVDGYSCALPVKLVGRRIRDGSSP